VCDEGTGPPPFDFVDRVFLVYTETSTAWPGLFPTSSHPLFEPMTLLALPTLRSSEPPAPDEDRRCPPSQTMAYIRSSRLPRILTELPRPSFSSPRVTEAPSPPAHAIPIEEASSPVLFSVRMNFIDARSSFMRAPSLSRFACPHSCRMTPTSADEVSMQSAPSLDQSQPSLLLDTWRGDSQELDFSRSKPYSGALFSIPESRDSSS